MANVMLDILEVFTSERVLMYPHSKSPFLQVTLNFELKELNVSTRHIN